MKLKKIKKIFVFSIMLLVGMTTVGMLNSCKKDKTNKDETIQDEPQKEVYVDLGLPSGTKWKSENETNSSSGDDFFTYDEAVAKFGDNLPTKLQAEELKNNCNWDFQNGVCKVTGTNGKYIILPASGFRYDGVDYVGSFGYFWTSTPEDALNAYEFHFSSYGKEVFYSARANGFSVRLVQK